MREVMNGIRAGGNQLVQALKARLLRRDFEYTSRIQAERDQSCDQREVQELVRVCERNVEENVGRPLGDSQLFLARGDAFARAEPSRSGGLSSTLARPHSDDELLDCGLLALRQMVSARKLLCRWRIGWRLKNPKRLCWHVLPQTILTLERPRRYLLWVTRVRFPAMMAFHDRIPKRDAGAPVREDRERHSMEWHDRKRRLRASRWS